MMRKNTGKMDRKNNGIIFFALAVVIMGAPLGWAAKVEPPAAAVPAAPDAVEQATIGASEDSTQETRDGNISLDFKEADINTVLRVLSLKSKVNIVSGPEVQGTVSIRLDDVPWEKALEVVLRTYNYVFERDGNIIRVTTRDKMAQEPVLTETYILNYTRATEIQDSVKDMLSERGRVRIAERTNTIVITDIPTNLYKIQEVIKKLDKRTPQAYIDSKIIKTAVGVAESMGIQWNPVGTLSGSSRPTQFPFYNRKGGKDESMIDAVTGFFPLNNGADTTVAAGDTTTTVSDNPSASRGFPLIPPSVAGETYQLGTLDFTSFQATLNFLKSRANTKIVSNPRIVVLNNQAAKVQVGQQIPLPKYERNETTGSVEVTGFKFRDVGIILNVTPHINSQEEILVELAPEVSAVNGNTNFTDFQVPNFDVTIANTQVLIRSGETIAIGGMLTDNFAMGENKVPYLSDIPVVGKLFRSKTQTAGTGNEKDETLFFVTVTMVDTEGQPVGERLEARKKAKMSQGAQAEDKNLQPAAEQAKNMTESVQASESLNSSNASAKSEETETKAA